MIGDIDSLNGYLVELYNGFKSDSVYIDIKCTSGFMLLYMYGPSNLVQGCPINSYILRSYQTVKIALASTSTV